MQWQRPAGAMLSDSDGAILCGRALGPEISGMASRRTLIVIDWRCLMFRKLPPSLFAVALSGVIALGAMTASAGPARADSRDAASILSGVIALYAIGRAIELSNNGRAPRQAPHVSVTRTHPHAPAPAHPPALVAPARCFVEGQDRNGYFRGYGRRCMQNHTARPRLLPQACLTTVHTQRGPREIYAGRCLANNGWVREAGFRP